MIIGDKSRFAIEIEYEHDGRYDWGYSRLWIQGQSMGDYEDRNLMMPFVNSVHLDKVRLESGMMPEVKMNLEPDKDKLFNILSTYALYEQNFERLVVSKYGSPLETETAHWPAGDENFDRTIGRMFVFEDKLHFLWKEFPDYTGTKNLGPLFYGEVSTSEFVAVVNELEALMNYEFR